MTARRRPAVGLLCATAVLLTSGCTSDDAGAAVPTPSIVVTGAPTAATGAGPQLDGKDAQQVLAASVAAAKATASVRMILRDDAAKIYQRNFVDIYVVKGKGAFGTVRVGDGTMQFISVPGKAWWRGDQAFWTGNGVPGNYKRFEKKWIEVGPKSEGFSDFILYADYAKTMDTMLAVNTDDGLALGPVQQIAGVRSQTLATSKGGGIAVAADGPPLPVKLSTATSSAEFTEWNINAEVEPPEKSTIVPLSKVPQTEPTA